MKIFLRILKIVAILILVVAAVGFIFFPGRVHVERSIDIKKPAEVTYNYVSDLKNWNNWSPWFKKDPAAKYEFSNQTNITGSMVKWESENNQVGKGTMTLTELKPDSAVYMNLAMGGGNSHAYYLVSPSENGSKLTWAFDVDFGANPLLRILGAYMKVKIVEDFDQGLNDLKTILESMPQEAQYKIEEVKVQPSYYLYVHDSASAEDIGQHLGKDYQMIGQSAAKQKLQMTGPPFAIYYTEGGTSWSFDAGAPFDKKGKDDGMVKSGERKEGNAVLVHYFGAYNRVSKAYAQGHEYIAKNNKKMTGAPWEVYMTDPMTEKDTAKWQTDIYFPIE